MYLARTTSRLLPTTVPLFLSRPITCPIIKPIAFFSQSSSSQKSGSDTSGSIKDFNSYINEYAKDQKISDQNSLLSNTKWGESRTDFSDAMKLLVFEHREFERMTEQINKETDLDKKQHLVEQFIRMVVVHSMTEEVQLYPKFDQHLSNGKKVHNHSVDQHKKVDTEFVQIEKLGVSSPDFQKHFDTVTNLLKEHIKEEEADFFLKVQRAMPSSELQKLLSDMIQVRKMVPTHPHPYTPQSVRASSVAGGLVGMMDRTRDLFNQASKNPLGV